MRYGWLALLTAGLAACQTDSPVEQTSIQAEYGNFCGAQPVALEYWNGQQDVPATGPLQWILYAQEAEGVGLVDNRIGVLTDTENAKVVKAYLINEQDVETFVVDHIDESIRVGGNPPPPPCDGQLNGDECFPALVAHAQLVHGSAARASELAAGCGQK